MSEYTFLEILNGIWTILDISLLGWFTYYIVAMYKELDYFNWKDALRRWRQDGLPPHINAAIAIYVFTTGDTIVRGHIWIWRHFQNLGHHSFPLLITPLVLGGVISATGLLCKIRVFTVYRFGNRAWIMSFILAFTLVIIAWITHLDS